MAQSFEQEKNQRGPLATLITWETVQININTKKNPIAQSYDYILTLIKRKNIVISIMRTESMVLYQWKSESFSPLYH